MSRYEVLCETCFSDLYRVACLVTGDSSAASELVEKALVKGVHQCHSLRTEAEVKLALMGILYELCRQASLVNPKAVRKSCNTILDGLAMDERILIVFRHCSGLRFSELCRAVGMSPSIMSLRLAEIRVKISPKQNR